ncbi:transglycosylase domain-containing protein [Micromonospora sp. CPCC 206060]|uniref:transglycosylase domain-containing protein n=1 Tax=Micromonospora sp. CPCC 206060 TaxID=3122406 RepID=UPI002FF07DC4
MNSYGDPSAPRGRAQIPGSNGDPGAGADDAYRRPAAPPGAAPSGRASVGSARVGGSAPAPRGSASPPSGPAAGSASAGRARVGRASVPVSPAPGGAAPAGRASVGGSAGRASVGGAPAGRATVGAASVGSAAVGGRAQVGRATAGRAAVSPVSPGAPGGGGPNGPGGPTGPGRRSRGAGDPDAVRRSKKRRRINLLIASFAVFIMLAGIGVVGFTYYSTNVVLPNKLKTPLASTMLANDGKYLLAKLGEQNRTLVTINQIPKVMQYAVAAAEDRNFYDHSGVDYKGIARAAWNNFTGGSKQGASTITQQYARNAYDSLNDDTYGRKVKEAIFASKLNDEYTKDQIMEYYLNIIYFGRGAYGIEAAAQTYFSKPVSAVTPSEAAVLAALIKQPVPQKGGHQGYDPEINLPEAQNRWNYVLNGMVEKGWLDPAERAKAEYPTKTLRKSSSGIGIDYGIKTPNGNVINYVKAEMKQLGVCTDDPAKITEKKPSCKTALQDGGYRITTTIDPKIQNAAIKTVQRKSKGSELSDQPPNLMAALVAVNPKNGQVLAYYGGDDGTGTDFAGKNTDPAGKVYGGHPPGSSFKIYTLAAGLEQGKSLQSLWKGKAFTPEGVTYKVSNAGNDNPACGDSCTLEHSTLKSYNVPFYYMAMDIGADKVVDVAKRAGVTTMWGNDEKPYDLVTKSAKDLTRDPFDYPVAYGQYPITVLDHANGVATFANNGVYNKAHFVIKIEKQEAGTGKWKPVAGEQLKSKRVIKADVVADVTSVLKKYPNQVNHTLANSREAASKTGTWELNAKSDDNAHAWMIGYTPQIAAAVWVGNEKAQKAIKLKDGRKISGGNLPGDIWERFMEEAHKGMKKEEFPPAANIGDPNSGNGELPPPPPTTAPLPPGCPNPLLPICQNPGGPNPGNPPGPGNGGPGGGTRDGGGLLPSPTATTRDD